MSNQQGIVSPHAVHLVNKTAEGNPENPVREKDIKTIKKTEYVNAICQHGNKNKTEHLSSHILFPFWT